jgi:hypothetical protein
VGTGASTANVNTSGKNYVSWMWKESATSGFDIVTFTGTGATNTVNHGLGVAPKFIIVRERDQADSNYVYHESNGAQSSQFLEGTQAKTASAGYFPTAPTASQFTVGTTQNTTGTNVVAYLFAEKDGFSKFGSYTGNGSTDGPFVYTGFKPRYIMIKRTDTTGDWMVYDSARDTYNAAGLQLYANSNLAEGDSRPDIDLLSNGFKLRDTNTAINASAGTYVYAAFAEQSFKYSAIPALIGTSGGAAFLMGFEQ